VIGRVGPQQLANPTPCPEYDVRALLAHLVTVLRRVAALGRDDDPFAHQVAAAVEGDAFQQAWMAAANDVDDAWADDSVLHRTVRLPWKEDSGAAILASYVNELTVHTWDLATATGQRPAFDPQVVSLAFDGIRFMPGQNRAAMFEAMAQRIPPPLRGAQPFADAVPVADDAPLIDRLVAWNGRRPRTALPC
nr:TIGR03086 family metal-binding protein [Actinomycetota bacterium]